MTGLTEFLSSPEANNTLFIPNNEVVDAYLDKKDLGSLLDLDNSKLKASVLNHFIP